MNPLPQTQPLTLGLFQKRMDGDDSLMELARCRFRQSGMGIEIYAENPGQLEWALRFCPSPDSPVTVHLARHLNLAEPESRRQIQVFANRFAGRVHGLVIHDHPDMASCPGSYLLAAREMNSILQCINHCPWLFIEYAAGLELPAFITFFHSIAELQRISVCMDIGHVGIHIIRKTYARNHPGADICALKSQSGLSPVIMAEVESSVQSALPVVLKLIGQLKVGDKPVHCHLHDGHPLSVISPFGVSDHLSFLAKIVSGVSHDNNLQTVPMFGRQGLFQIVAQAIQNFGRERISFTLEIHPTMERLALGAEAGLFQHWRDKTNAEKMNHWLSVLSENHQALRESIQAALAANPLSNKPR